MKVLISCKDFARPNLNKQPWKYVYEIAKFLVKQKDEVIIVTNGQYGDDYIDGIRIVHIRKLFNVFIGETQDFNNIIVKENPEKIVMLLGMTSFLRCSYKLAKPVIGIITSPVYNVRELLRNVGIADSLLHIDMMVIHYVNAIIPPFFIKRWVNKFDKIVVLSEWNKRRISEKGVDRESIIVIPPSIDDAWFTANDSHIIDKRYSNFHKPEIVYFTSPLSLRGTSILIKAFSQVLTKDDAKLKFICRIDSGNSEKEIKTLKSLVKKEGIIENVEFIENNLEISELINEICKSDIVCIPFKIVISDVPISLLEAMAVKIPVLSTQVSSIPEVLMDVGMCVKPNSPSALSHAIISIINDNLLMMSMGEKGREKMATYDRWDGVGTKFKYLLVTSIER